jgi:hypothetical protein
VSGPPATPGSFTTTPDAKDWLSAYWLVTRRRWLWKRLAIAIFLIWAIYSGLLIGIDTLDFGWRPEWAATTFLDAIWYTLIVVIALVGITMLLTPRRVGKHVIDTKRLAPETFFEFDTHGVRTRNGVSTSTLTWPQFERCLENSRVLLLMVTRQSMFIIRKSEVDQHTMAALRAQITAAAVPRD